MRFLRLIIMVAVILSLALTILPVRLASAQAADSTVKIEIALPGSSRQQFDGTYLGHGLILTSWPAATLYGLQNVGKQNVAPFLSPRHRVAHYVVPAPSDPANPDYAAFQFAWCADRWLLRTDPAAKDCVSFELAALTTVQHGADAPVAVKRLIYASQATNIAILELSTIPTTWMAERLANTVTDSITVYAPWLNDMYGAFVNRNDTPLQAVFQEALIVPVIGKPTIGDPTTPELGNTGYDVTHYDLDLHFSPNNVSMTAIAKLDMRVTYPQLSGFSLDFSTLLARQVTINGAVAKFRQDAQSQKLIVSPAQPLLFGQKVQVVVAYGGILKDFRSRYMPFVQTGLLVDSATRRVYDIDEPDGAHSWFPCNDQPLDRATYTFHITVASDLTALANGQQQGDPVDNHDGTHTFTWVMPHTMPTYLAVIAVANYVATPLPDGPPGIPLTSYTFADAPAGSAFDVSGPIMKLEIARFGPFPFESYGQALVTEDGVGMESQTMTLMFGGLPDAGAATIYFFVSHEMSHQWFGDSVTLSTWGDIWLNEGFASYAEYTMFSDSGNLADAANTLRDWKHSLVKTVNSQAVTHLSSDNLFGTEAYDKAGFVLHMLREKIGDAAFFKTLQTYAARFAYGNTTTDRFWATAEEVSGQDLSAFFSQWLQQVDIPRVDVTWTETNGKASALACARTTAAQAFSIDVPLVFSTAVVPNQPILPAATPDSNSSNNGTQSAKFAPAAIARSVSQTNQTDSEMLHLNQSSGSADYVIGFVAKSVLADPNNTVLADIRLVHVDTLPTSCPLPAKTIQ